MPKSTKHILVIRLSAMGDVAMTVPVLRTFTQQHPQIKVTVLTRAHFTPFFRDLSNVKVFPVDLNGKHKGVWGLYKLTKELKRLNIDAVADLHNVLRTKILKLFFFGKTFVPIDKGRAEKKALVSGKIFHQLKTTHQRYANVFKTIGFEVDLLSPTFPERAKLNDKTKAILGMGSKKWIGIAPFATYVSKMYPLDLMERVIETLSETHKIALFGGGQKEIDNLNTFESKFHNVINIAGKLSLREELDVISNLEVMISMDSGNAHLAAMLGVKVITLWGVTHPYAGFAPFNQPNHYAFLTDRKQFPLIPTSIYGNKYPEEYKEASGSILHKEIIKKIESII